MPEPVPLSSPTLSESALLSQREQTRRSLVRANTAVALVLGVVVALALAAVVQGWRARRLQRQAEANQNRAEQAEAAGRSELWRAYLSDAHSTRLSHTLERRPAALETIRRAAALRAAPELRNEAVATLALPDFQLESTLEFEPGFSAFAAEPHLRFCALGLTNGDVVVRSLADGKQSARLHKADGQIPEEQQGVGALEFSPDGRALAARYQRGGWAIWDWAAGRTMFRHDIDKPRRLAASARFSSDGRFVVAPVFTPRDGMGVFEWATGRQVALFAEFSSFRHAAVRPHAPVFAANNGTNVVVMNWETGQRVTELPFEAGVRRLAWSRDGASLAIAGNLLEVHVWNLAEKQRRTFAGHKSDVWNVVFDPGGDRIAAAGTDGSARIWDTHAGNLLGVTTEGYVTQWSEDNRVGWVRPGHSLEVRQLAPSPVCQSSIGPPQIADGRTMDISCDGTWAVSVAEGRGLVVWRLPIDGPPGWIPLQGVRSLCFHPRVARLFLTGIGRGESRSYSSRTNGTEVTLALGEPSSLGVDSNKRLDLVTTSADGKTIAAVELTAGRVLVEHVGMTNQPVSILEVMHSSVANQSSSPAGGGTISLSPDGRWIACGYSSRGAQVFDAHTGRQVARLSPRQGVVHFSPDGKWLAVSEAGEFSVFQVGAWNLLWRVKRGRDSSTLVPAAFSPDGLTLAVLKSSQAAALVETSTGRELTELEAPDASPIAALRWSGDGRRLICATRENHLEVWEPAVLRQQLALLGLDWNSQSNAPVAVAGLGPPLPDPSPAWIVAGVLATVGLVAVIALLALRRHRHLVEDFAHTAALAATRTRELDLEREVGRLKTSFVSMVSHEFRTPLAVIQSSAQILDRYLERLGPEQRREQLDAINGNVDRMARLIEEVLLLGKVEGGQLRCTPAALDLAEFCRRFTDEMLSATNRRCPIRLELAEPGFPPAQADEDLLRHILGNLVSNAVKYSAPDSLVKLQVSRRDGSAVFVISDHGIGIPVSDREKLFTAFQRGSNVTRHSGTGLGLTIVKRCVELHQGEISFTSEEAQGTSFQVALPLFESEKFRQSPRD